MNYRELARRVELNGLRETTSALREAFDEGHLRPDEFSLRDLAEHLIPDGREVLTSLPIGQIRGRWRWPNWHWQRRPRVRRRRRFFTESVRNY